MSLAHRDRQPEVMDDPTLDADQHRHALAGLARINRWTRSGHVFWPRLKQLAQQSKKPLRVLDLATGSGDIPLSLTRLARKHSVELVVEGCDISDIALSVARQQAPDCRFFQRDLLAEAIPTGYDVVLSSLFLHHLETPDVVRLLANVKAAEPRMILMSDLVRGRLNYGLVWLASRIFSRSSVVHIDGPLSIRAAFTRGELLQLTQEAGLEGVTIRSTPPCRMLLEWTDLSLSPFGERGEEQE